jgi:hypothetical protein
MTCKNCNKAFTCGCQKAKAADGANVHKTCLTEYNNKINASPVGVAKDNLTKTVQRATRNLKR